MAMIEKISTKSMSHQEWLNYRSKTIGGSDAAVVVGLNEYSSPYALWAEKTGKMPEKQDNEAMRQGRDLEGYVAKRFEEATEKKVKRSNCILKNTEYPFAHANIDRQIVGEKAGLECKTTSVMNTRKFVNGEYPENYYVQCVHYLAVTGFEKWYLAVLILNQGFHIYEIQRDEAEIKALMDAEAEFYKYIVNDEPPPVDGLSSTSLALETIYENSYSNDTPVDLFAYEDSITAYLAASQKLKEVEAEKELYAQRMQEALKESEIGTSPIAKVTWKSQSRSFFQAEDFRRDHPDLDLSKYFKATNFRTFKVRPYKK